jgi:hypothetical protein
MKRAWSTTTTAAALAASLAACRVGEPTPEPVRGELPRVVAVWPRAVAADANGDCCLAGLDQALRGRGYRAVPVAVAAELLAAAPVAPAGPAAAGAVLGCEAVMELVVGEFTASGARPLREAQWDLQWRLVSTRGAGVVWSQTLRGRWVAPTRDFGDPHRPLDAEPEIVPIGGGAPVTWRDEAELLAALHRTALARLPACPR